MDVLLAWWYGLALGAERFAHMTRYRRDPLLPSYGVGYLYDCSLRWTLLFMMFVMLIVSVGYAKQEFEGVLGSAHPL